MESIEFSAFSTGDCRLIDLRSTTTGGIKMCSPVGSLPFAAKRVFYIYDINTGNHQRGHAHYREQQALVAIRGHFDVTVSDGVSEATFHLNSDDKALYIPSGIWCSLSNFTADAICLVLSSTKFDDADYIRDFSRFIALRS